MQIQPETQRKTGGPDDGEESQTNGDPHRSKRFVHRKSDPRHSAVSAAKRVLVNVHIAERELRFLPSLETAAIHPWGTRDCFAPSVPPEDPVLHL